MNLDVFLCLRGNLENNRQKMCCICLHTLVLGKQLKALLIKTKSSLIKESLTIVRLSFYISYLSYSFLIYSRGVSFILRLKT